MQSLTRCNSGSHSFSTTSRVMELEAILVVGQANLEGPGIARGPQGPNGTSGSSKGWRRWIIGFISSFVFRCNQFGLTSRIFLPEDNHCPLTRIKCGTKIELGCRTNPRAKRSSTGFSRVAPKQWIHRWPQRCQKCLRGCPGKPFIQHWKCIFGKMTWKGCHMRRKILCNCRWIPVKDQLFP